MPPAAAEPKTFQLQLRAFKGVNQVDSRVAIDDDELAWMENAMAVGKGAIQTLPGPGASIAATAGGMASLWGFTLQGAPVAIVVGLDGSLWQVAIPAGTVTAIAPGGTVTAPGHAAHLTIWRDTTVLILDPVKGYMQWDGTTFTVIDATVLGESHAVFSGRVWISKGRTIQFSAPGTFDDFNTAHGASAFTITDEAFPGSVVAMASVGEQLWLVGTGAVETIGNVTSSGASPNVLTLFSVTNIVTGVGTASPHSALGYFRALTFLAPFGLYGLAGVTPQKLSDKLDGLFPLLSIGDEAVGAIGVVQSLPVLMTLVTYHDPVAGPRPLLLCFTQGKWFFASQGDLTWITTVLVNGVSQVWGTDGTQLYQAFGAPATSPWNYLIITKLYDFGSGVTMKAVTKAGFEFQASQIIAPTFTVDSEKGSQAVAFNVANAITAILNTLGVPMQLVNDVGDPLTILTTGMGLAKKVSHMYGMYLGVTIAGNDPPYRVQAIELEVTKTREWNTP